MAKATETKEVAPKERYEVQGAELFDLKSNLNDIQVRLPQIGIVHQGQVFKMPDGSKVGSFQGIILDLNMTNAWWEKSFQETGGGTPPECFSMDGRKVDPRSEMPQSETGACIDCKWDKFGTDMKDGRPGKGKACKNMKRVHIIMENEMMPYRLTLPPSSLEAIDKYVSLLTSRGLPYQLVVTNFALAEAFNDQGIAFSKIALSDVGAITDMDMAKKIRHQRDQWMDTMRFQEVNTDEYAPAS
jgi:hypothetical protein